MSNTNASKMPEQSEPSRVDIYGSRARIGYTSPPLTTEVFPYEFYEIVPKGVTLVVTSLAIVVRSKDEIDRSYDISMGAAREMAAAGCDIVVLGGVPINLSRGAENSEQVIRDLEGELKIKVATSASAQAAAAKALGCKKVVVAQPYEAKNTERIAGYAVHFGCEVLGATGWGSPFNQIGRIPRHAAIEMGRALMRQHPDADSILFPSPHWPTAGALDLLEREFGVNCMSAHQAIIWHALRRCGVDDRIEGFGRLFREF
jgi:maleate isomerase